MKRMTFTILLIAFAFTTSFAQKKNLYISDNNGKTTISIQDSKQKLDLKVKGETTFTEDEKGIESLSHGGSISYKKNNNKLKVSRESDGSLLYVINGAKKSVPDTKDELIIAECVNTLINLGINGKERAQKIYRKIGFNGVLKEVDRFESDYVKHIYLNALGSNSSLSNDEMLSFIKKADTYLSSDYYKAELLNTVQENYLKNEVTSNEYLKTVKNIKSDYYQAVTLQKILKQPLTEKQSEEVLTIVNTIASDYYKSDVLKSIINNEKKSEKEWSQLIRNTTKIDSDYYKAEVLKKIALAMPENETLQMEFKEAVKSIQSDYYYGSVIRATRD